MQPHPRYDIIAQIASGDYATVFRARDKELARDVAIKQIHPHFLSDPMQLNRYWEESQILASLEHPNVLTIYDIDRQRGWLILELMTDTMQSRAGGQPLDLQVIRMGLICGLKALQFLHKRKIIHGDVKPSNLLIDRQNWIKLGDFGFAQRATNDQGSLFKGTTRYIAPERVDPERFGPVSPASDLYSLGFSMYELLCGNAFDSLFPGLNAFGADKQVAWMMWHAGPDRKVPKISRVLKGVPEDLAQVIDRLVEKDPKVRYRDAEEAIRDLKIGMGKGTVGPTEAEKAEAEAAAAADAQQKRRKKLLIAACCSLVVSVLLLWPWEGDPNQNNKPQRQLLSIGGRIVQVIPADGKASSPEPSGDPAMQAQPPLLGTFVVDTDNDRAHQSVNIRPFDQIYINDEQLDLQDEQFGMQLFEIDDVIHTQIDTDRTTGQQLQIIHVARPVQDAGVIVAVQPQKQGFVLKRAGNENRLQTIFIRLPKQITIEVNGNKQSINQSNAISFLKEQDLVEVSHKADTDDGKRKEGRIAKPKSTIRVTRKLISEGEIQNADVTLGILDLKTKDNDILQIPLAKDCEVVLNGRTIIGDRRISLADLKYRDAVTVHHDTRAVRINAQRMSEGEGQITQIIPAARKMSVRLQDDGAPVVTFQIPEAVTPTLGKKPVSLEELQPTDSVRMSYDGTDPQHPVIRQLSADRPPKRDRWALIMGFDEYDDHTLSPVDHLGADATGIHNTLIERYRVPKDQTLFLGNISRDELKAKVASFLERVRPDGELLVYYGGHAYLDQSQQPQLATKDFELLDPKGTGLPLKWLIDEIESCEAKDKVLFLDTCHEGSGNDLKQEPGSEGQIQTLEEDRTQPALRTLTVVASCRTGQRGKRGGDGGHFANAIQTAYRGAADANGDQSVSVHEASEHILHAISKGTGGNQTSVVVKPGTIVPPRFTPAMIEEIKTLADKLKQRRVAAAQIAPLMNSLQSNAGDEPEPLLLCGLAEIQLGNEKKAIARLEEVTDNPIALQGIIWSHYQLRQYEEAINPLIALIQETSRELKGDEQRAAEAKRVLEWAGTLREFAAEAVVEKDRISEVDAKSIDDAAATAGRRATTYYQKGRDSAKYTIANFDREIEAATADSTKRNIRNNKKSKLDNYATLNLPLLVSEILRSINDKL